MNCRKHEQEHAHDHGHEHGHEKTLELEFATVELSSHAHEQATAVSATININEGREICFARIVEAMQAIAVDAEAAGGIVGHIKGYAETSQGFAHASCTGAGLGIDVEGRPKLALSAESQVQIVAIVMLVDLEKLTCIVSSALGKAL